MANSLCLSRLKILHGFSMQLKCPGVAEMLPTCSMWHGTIGYRTGCRHSSFRSSPPFGHIDDHPPVEITKNPPEWKFVERLLGTNTVPAPMPRPHYPSGWLPQQSDAAQRDYFIARTRNHMLPVYLVDKFRGSKKVTRVRRIEGDIWKLEQELRDVIEKAAGRKILSRINEMSGQIAFTGAFVNIIKDYLQEKGY